MPFGEVRLVPGVDLEKTPTLNSTGIASANLVRWREGLVEKIGGWVRFYPLALTGNSTPRDLHAWQDLNTVDWLAIGATTSLSVLASGVLSDITPQQTTTNTYPYFSTTNGSAVIQIQDLNIISPTTNNSVFIKTPVSIGGLILSGLYPITANINSNTYQINAGTNANKSTTSSTVTITSANPGVVTWTANGLSANDPVFFSTTGALPTNITPYQPYFVVSPAANTFQIAATPGGTSIDTTAGTQSGTQTAVANAGIVPMFTTTNGSATVTVRLPNHGQSVGATASFLVSTIVGGATITGSYSVQTVTDTNNYTISATPSASSSTTGFENGGQVRSLYYIAIGPQAQAQPYGAGPYGTTGAYGIGTAAPAGQGTPITTTDWTQVNWGQILLACPTGDGIYAWQPNSGFRNAKLVATAPSINTGIFIANPYQIVVAYGSSKNGVANPLQVSWCTIGDYTQWQVLTTDTAGNYQIPSGSLCIGGLSVPNQQLIWTDIELWSMQFIGFPNVFGFNKIMAGCGLIGGHAMGLLGETVYWLNQGQVFRMPAGGAPAPLPCSVWDFLFQNLDTTNAWKIRCAPNSQFNTIAWHFPSLSGGTGENDSYIEYNAVEGEWTAGQYPATGRSAWTDQSVLGSPIGAGPNGVIYQHEKGYNADGGPINATFTTGWFVLGTGEQFVVVDQLIPDFKYGLQGGAQTASPLVTIQVCNYPNDTITSAGPFTVSQATQYISLRLRGRQCRLTVQSLDLNSFFRLGLIRYRYAPAGRR